MRFDITALLMAMATTTIADRLEVRTNCLFGGCDSSEGRFITDYAAYDVNANAGCRGTSVPGMTEFCMDWPNRRAHFRFSHQANKRCLIIDTDVKISCSGGWDCYRSTWKEVGCTWREVPVPEKDLASESQPATAKATVSFSG
ncbi:hypothetical protein FLONG3_9557 [Fusarium longipes]|uniref:Uncharacterized protein n=1 Tax=Fusarium longipes TaxID=694270 RepID=A0A395RWH9_9HYPO|nr:hypothetical protein FLONG3_9557 [Fusarium longipes]